MSKKVLVALPQGLLETIDFIAQAEHRTRSDLVRESLRRYIQSYRPIDNMIVSDRTLSEQKATAPLPPKEILPISDTWEEARTLALKTFIQER